MTQVVACLKSPLTFKGFINSRLPVMQSLNEDQTKELKITSQVVCSKPTSRHVGTLGKSFTHSCLYDMMWHPAWLPWGEIQLM